MADNEKNKGAKDYYRAILQTDIGEVARELLNTRITAETGGVLLCDCPHHASASKKSLHINLKNQNWYCFGCGLGGDALHLVEFIQSGIRTKADQRRQALPRIRGNELSNANAATSRKMPAGLPPESGKMSETHRAARDWLAAKADLPPLSEYGLSPGEVAKLEERRDEERRVGQALFSVARYYNWRLRSRPEVMAWLKENYAITEETVDKLLIGYSDNGPWENKSGAVVRSAQAYLTRKGGQFTHEDLAATGAFRLTEKGWLAPFFQNRIVFPYWRDGKIVYMIGRKTPWTEDSKYEQGKYKKLPIYNSKNNAHVSRSVKNILYNEDALSEKPGKIIITEGVTDCIALLERGFETISPVTVRLQAGDFERVADKLRAAENVYICQDNELSEAGLKGALDTARKLSEHGIYARIVRLPLNDAQQTARNALQERFGITSAPNPKELRERLKTLEPADAAEAEKLIGEAKVDVNEFFRAGGTAEQFAGLLFEAKLPVDFLIESIPTDLEQKELVERIREVLKPVALMDGIEVENTLTAIQQRFGKDRVTIGGLREELKRLRASYKGWAKEKLTRSKYVKDAEPGSCAFAVGSRLAETELEHGSADYAAAASAATDWFAAHGSMFFRTRAGMPYMYYDKEIYWLDSADRGRRREFLGLMHKTTGMQSTTPGGRTFLDAVANHAVVAGQVRDQFNWLHTNVGKFIVWFNLNNDRHEIARLSPSGIEIVKNGGNDERVILCGSEKIWAINFIADADPVVADQLIKRLIIDNLTCSEDDKLLIMAWLSCFLLIDFAGTRPGTRFEGPAGSGKTTAAKILTTLIYGSPQQKKSTDAANYTDGAKNPLLALDNIEVKDMTDELTNFMLTSITGITREKRKGGTDAETVTEQTKCLLNTTGIEPLCGNLTEILTRTLVFNFEMDERASDCFLETEVIAEIQRHRDYILSALMKRTCEVLAMLRDGRRKDIMRLLSSSLGAHDKRRCNDYLSLMYLMAFAGAPADEQRAAFVELHPAYARQIEKLNERSQEIASEANPIASALSALFNGYRIARELDAKGLFDDYNRGGREANFIERYQVRFKSGHELEPMLSGQLLNTLSRISRDNNLKLGLTNASQFSKRLRNDAKVLREAGYKIQWEYNRHKNGTMYKVSGESP